MAGAARRLLLPLALAAAVAQAFLVRPLPQPGAVGVWAATGSRRAAAPAVRMMVRTVIRDHLCLDWTWLLPNVHPPIPNSRLTIRATHHPHRCMQVGKAGGANLDWANLGFEFRPTKSHIKFVWKNGQWDEVRD